MANAKYLFARSKHALSALKPDLHAIANTAWNNKKAIAIATAGCLATVAAAPYISRGARSIQTTVHRVGRNCLQTINTWLNNRLRSWQNTRFRQSLARYAATLLPRRVPAEARNLFNAAAQGNHDAIRQEIAHGANPNAINVLGQTALSRAIKYNHLDAVNALLENGTDPNIPAHGVIASPLWQTLTENKPAIAQALLQHGANPNESRLGQSPLHWALMGYVLGRNQSMTLLHILLEGGADVTEDGLLHDETNRDHVETTKLLMRYGANNNIPSGIYHGQTALLAASQRIHDIFNHSFNTILSAMAGERANFNEIERELPNIFIDAVHPGDGSCLLHHLVGNYNAEPTAADNLIRIIIRDHHAFVNRQNDQGRTPLHLAAVNGNTRIARLLLSAGARVNLQDIYGNTPLDYLAHTAHQLSPADYNRFAALRDLFIQHGAVFDGNAYEPNPEFFDRIMHGEQYQRNQNA